MVGVFHAESLFVILISDLNPRLLWPHMSQIYTRLAVAGRKNLRALPIHHCLAHEVAYKKLPTATTA